MSEKPDPNPKPREQVYIRLRSGELISMSEHMERQRKTETQISTDLLRSGDLVAFQYKKQDGTIAGYAFEIASAEWDDLGLSASFCPGANLTGKLYGADLSPSVVDKDAKFLGSGTGSSMLQPDVIITDSSPYFYFKEGEYHAPSFDKFEVFRRGADDFLSPLAPSQLEAEATKENAKHNERLEDVEKLVKIFGFDYDIRDATQVYKFRHPSFASEAEHIVNASLMYEDSRYIAQYEAGAANGNKLAVFDKKTGLWTEFKYFNFSGEDVLQIAYADLSGLELEQVFDETGWIADEPAISITKVAVTTFTTSGKLGIEAANFSPSLKEAAEVLRVPKVRYSDDLYMPNIQLLPEGRVHIPVGYLYNEVEEIIPGFNQGLVDKASFEVKDDGIVEINIGSHAIMLKNPDAEIKKLIDTLDSQSYQKHKAERVKRTQKVGRAVGRFIRRPK